jgi:dipeptide/tripeptide permease
MTSLLKSSVLISLKTGSCQYLSRTFMIHFILFFNQFNPTQILNENHIIAIENRAIKEITPRHIFCVSKILLNFSFFLLSAILPLFLHQRLFLDHNASTAIFHAFECMMLIFTIFGAIIADTWLGLYRSVILMSCVYVIGLGCISTAMIERLNLPVE